jgi:hypothetical protein
MSPVHSTHHTPTLGARCTVTRRTLPHPAEARWHTIAAPQGGATATARHHAARRWDARSCLHDHYTRPKAQICRRQSARTLPAP